jgi:hypothetical protein
MSLATNMCHTASLRFNSWANSGSSFDLSSIQHLLFSDVKRRSKPSHKIGEH